MLIGLKTGFGLLFEWPLKTGFTVHVLIANDMLKNEDLPSLKTLIDVVFIMLISIKMPTIIGILIFMSMINFMS